MALRQYPNYYSTNLILPANTTSDSTGGVAAIFGFNATYLRLLNKSAIDIYVTPLSTGGGVSTADMQVRACSDLVLPSVPQIAGLTAYSTSTVAAGPVLSVTALARSL